MSVEFDPPLLWHCEDLSYAQKQKKRLLRNEAAVSKVLLIESNGVAHVDHGL